MIRTLYVGNLPWSTTAEELEAYLIGAGIQPGQVRILSDRDTGRSRGCGFVDVPAAHFDAAIGALDGQDLGGRTLRAEPARSRPAAAVGRGEGGPEPR